MTVLCLIGLLQSPLLVGAEPQLGVPFPDGKLNFFPVLKDFNRISVQVVRLRSL